MCKLCVDDIFQGSISLLNKTATKDLTAAFRKQTNFEIGIHEAETGFQKLTLSDQKGTADLGKFSCSVSTTPLWLDLAGGKPNKVSTK